MQLRFGGHTAGINMRFILDKDQLTVSLEKHRLDQLSNLAFDVDWKFGATQFVQGDQTGHVAVYSADPPEGAEETNPGGTAFSGGSAPAGTRPASWGGYTPGFIPLSALQAIQSGGSKYTQGMYWLRPDAAHAYTDMKAAAQADGINITVCSAYRTRAQQISLQGTGRAAAPGRSNHEKALAIDIAGLFCSSRSEVPHMESTRLYQWIAANGGKYGWYNPPELRGSEPWHCDFWGRN